MLESVTFYCIKLFLSIYLMLSLILDIKLNTGHIFVCFSAVIYCKFLMYFKSAESELSDIFVSNGYKLFAYCTCHNKNRP